MPTTEHEFFFFDCETTGLPRTCHFSSDDIDGWPRLVQIAWARYDPRETPLGSGSSIIRPEGFRIPAEAAGIHGISHSHALRAGRELGEVLDEFLAAAEKPGTVLVAHNLAFDLGVVGSELVRTNKSLGFLDIPGICTMRSTTDLCRLPRPGGFGFKWPTLEELHLWIFGRPYEGAHDATRDLDACARSFFKLLRAGHFPLP